MDGWEQGITKADRNLRLLLQIKPFLAPFPPLFRMGHPSSQKGAHKSTPGSGEVSKITFSLCCTGSLSFIFPLFCKLGK